jgi:hypothetical protein
MAELTSLIARELVEAVRQESSEIVAGARDGRRTVADARHHLTVINAQLDVALAFLIARDGAHAASRRAQRPRVRYRLLLPRLPNVNLIAVGLVVFVAAVAAFTAGWWTMQPDRVVGGTQPDAIPVTRSDSRPMVEAVSDSVEPAPVGTTARSSPATREPLILAAEAWLDAYYRQDQGRMASLASRALRVSDERAASERLPRGLPVERRLEGTRVEVYGSTAIVTAKMTETAASGPGPTGSAATVAYISQIWSQQADGWRVLEVRILSADAVGRAFRR